MIGLRPHTAARFATNHFHGTWHVVSDQHGARLFARLLWGLSYQRRPGTLVLIDRPFLDPTPFEAEPSDPFVLVPQELTRLTERAARQLRHRLPLAGPPDGTVRWRTPGLDVVRADPAAYRDGSRFGASACHTREPGEVTRRGGLIAFTARRDLMRAWAHRADGLRTRHDRPTDHAEIRWPDGEFQIFRDYRRMVSSASAARRDLLAESAGSADGTQDDALRAELWRRAARMRGRRAAQTLRAG